MRLKAWVEAMRLRTLPVSVAGVIMAVGFNLEEGSFRLSMASLCLVFAVLAQVASNFANEYYDFKAGLDRKDRQGPRRGVTEGDISPLAMKAATYITLLAACAVGLVIASLAGWWLVPVGILIALGVIAYSAGPYPLSRHGWGEVAVLFFFGIIPVNLTYYVQAGHFWWPVALASLSVGLMGANVLIVNNYRDYEDDRLVGKETLAVKWGRNTVSTLYMINGYVAVALMMPMWLRESVISLIVPVAYLVFHTMAWITIISRRGSALNPMLGVTSCLMLAYALAYLLIQLVRI
ncbi:MAG: 1,4-dihydroxy-2-naphthoate octaprenyltransferase [Pseudoflavonifractor sp.]|nr:1,4-dihydroxy-2-naphthoate octaprenyltransferase [Pseudoflavonifractor sp.]